MNVFELESPNFVRQIKKLTLPEATRLISTLNTYGFGCRLVGPDFVIDGKSALGTIAVTYSNAAELRIYGVPDDQVGQLNKDLAEFYR